MVSGAFPSTLLETRTPDTLVKSNAFLDLLAEKVNEYGDFLGYGCARRKKSCTAVYGGEDNV